MEIWKSIPSAPFYEASSLGRVRRVRGGQGARNGHVLTSWVKNNGYLAVALRHGEGKRTHSVHRLVCEAFYGPPAPGQNAAHLDGNRSNNASSNLAWKSAIANHADKELHGTLLHGERHPRSKLTFGDIYTIHFMLRRGDRMTDIAALLDVSDATIFDIHHKRRWRRETEIIERAA